MIVRLPILNRPETKTINNRIYDKESYIKAIKEYINLFESINQHAYIYMYDKSFTSDYSLAEFMTYNLDHLLGYIISFNEDDFTMNINIPNRYEEDFKSIDQYYIQFRVIAEIKMNKTYIRKIVHVEVNNDHNNIVNDLW